MTLEPPQPLPCSWACTREGITTQARGQTAVAWRGRAKGKSVPLVSWVPGRGEPAVSALYLREGQASKGVGRHLVVQSLCRAEGTLH